MFEVGKKYKYNMRGDVHDCLAVTSDYAWLAVGGGKGMLVDQPHDGWKEYIEPKVTTIEATIRQHPDTGCLYTIEGDKMFGCYDRNKGSIRVTYTEGQGLTAEVIE